MGCTHEINRIEELAEYRSVWGRLLDETPGASFFQSLEWLEIYWRHFGAGQQLRTLVVGSADCSAADRPLGILPLVVRTEATRVGRLRVLTYPLHDWGSFYGAVGSNPAETLRAGLEHIRRTKRDWDILELRWLGAPGTDAEQVAAAMRESGFQAYRTVWDRTATVALSGTWEAYLAARPRRWRRNVRQAERRLARQGDVSLLRYRPRGLAHGDGDPRWDLYDACEQIARQSWQAAATNGTTLSHESVRLFLREVHAAAAAAGAVDLNLLLLDGNPLAFVYNYQCRGYVYGLRAGFDATRSREGAGTVLWALAIADSFARGDRVFDLGVGATGWKRHFMTGAADILRVSHFHPTALRAQLLRLKRWTEHCAAASLETVVG